MKINKILLVIFLAVLVSVPGLVALSYYISTMEDPVSYGAVSKLELTEPGGAQFIYMKGDICEEESIGEDLLAYFIDMNERAVFVSGLPELVTQDNRFLVTFESYNRTVTYQYYFTTDSSYAYFINDVGDVYRITEEDAIAFLKSSFSHSLYSASAAPIFTVSGQTVLPYSMSWSYPCYDDEFRSVSVQTSNTIPEFVVRGGIVTLFDNIPDYAGVQIYSASASEGAEPIYDGLLGAIPPSLFTENSEFLLKVTAKWVLDETTKDSFGEGSYQFKIKTLAPAVFYLSATAVQPGEFVVLTATNVTDPMKISFESTPSIGYTPVFYQDGEVYHAFIPVGIALSEMPSSFSFKLSYEGVDQAMQLNITPKEFKRQNYSASKALIESNRSEAAFSEFENALSGIFSAVSDACYLTDETFLSPAVDAPIRTGFGLYRTLSEIGETYRHEGVDYVIYGDDHEAIAPMDGKVVYVGELSLTGKVVVIDHGYGLRSLIAHLDSYDVKVGDVVKRGESIGICGKTGFTMDLNLHYGLYIGNIPVCPYDAQDYGVQMTKIDSEKTV